MKLRPWLLVFLLLVLTTSASAQSRDISSVPPADRSTLIGFRCAKDGPK